jgi:hypothetical protein
MDRDAPAAQCTLSTAGTVTTVAVGVKRSVVYEFDTSVTKPNLALPYAVAVDGKVLPAYADQPRALDHSRKISLLVDPGSRVALYLNSDVHPDHRRHPVYAVKVGLNDVLVKITERRGRISHERSELRQPYCRASSTPSKRVEVYEAALTGDIWMEISHRYTVGEADALLPEDTPAAARDGVRRIYGVLPGREIVIQFPASDSAPKLALRLRFDESDNVRENITHCPLLSDVLPRTHPRAFAALLSAARAAGVAEIRVTSCWRPMFGSIAHRAGLGLDISYIEGGGQRVSLNRAALTKSGGMQAGNVSEREKELYANYLRARKEAEESTPKLLAVRQQLDRNRDPGLTSQVQQRVASAEQHVRDLVRDAADAKDEWEEELHRRQPSLIGNLRGGLARSKSVKQIFDPWYMDPNTQDKVPAPPNEQRSPNEKIHDNHLHITVMEPRIL